MLVGIRFVAVLTGAIAQRFLMPSVEAEEEAVEQELDAPSGAILRELRDLPDRLDKLGAALQRRPG